MITQKQAEQMAEQYCKENRGDAFEYAAFVAGANWAIEQMQAESERLNSPLVGSANEAGRLRAENERLREALHTALARMQGGYISSAKDAIKEVLNIEP
jgi:regulator of replication initiation timing